MFLFPLVNDLVMEMMCHGLFWSIIIEKVYYRRKLTVKQRYYLIYSSLNVIYMKYEMKKKIY